MEDAPTVGTLEEAAELARNWNEWKRQPGMPMAVPRMVRPSDDKPARKYPGCQTVEIDVPADLWKTFTHRCELLGMDPSRIVSAMILQHCVNRRPGNFGDRMVHNLATWEASRKRKVRTWPEPETADV